MTAWLHDCMTAWLYDCMTVNLCFIHLSKIEKKRKSNNHYSAKVKSAITCTNDSEIEILDI